MPSMEGLGAPWPEDWVKLRAVVVVAAVEVLFLLLLTLRAARLVRTRAAVEAVESRRAEARNVAVWSVRPGRIAGTRPFCREAMFIVTVAASDELLGGGVRRGVSMCRWCGCEWNT